MKKLSFIFVVAALLFVACDKEEVDQPNSGKQKTFTATVGSNSKAGIRSGLKQGFASGDKITVWTETASSGTFTASGLGSATNGFYSAVKFTGHDIGGTEYVAIYPQGIFNPTYNTSTKKIGPLQINSTQTAVKGSYDPNYALMVAHTTDTSFAFINCCAFIKFLIPNDVLSQKINKLPKLTLNFEDIAEGNCPNGNDFYADPTTGVLTNTDDYSAYPVPIELKMPEGTYFEKGEYYVVIAPGTYKSIFCVCIPEDGTAEMFYCKILTDVTFERGKVYTLNYNDFTIR